MKNALITGVTGQDGSYLAELLLEKGYKVYGLVRRKSKVDYGNVEHLKDKIEFIYADMTDLVSLVNAMWLMLQQDEPNDYVIATNETRTVREFVETAFRHVGMEIVWEGEGVDEIGIDKNTGKVVVKVNPKFFRPAEVELLIGNPAKAEEELGWKREISFSELVERMTKNDLELVKKELGMKEE